jgi:UDP-hydrolysing UDP-N-acetyl-D-glucosamine 2-epimerase
MAEVSRIDIVSTSRADFSLVRPIAESLAHESTLAGRMVFTGAHFLEFERKSLASRRAEVGMDTVEVPCKGIGIDRQSSSRAMAQILGGFADLWADRAPDACVVLGDRFELLPVVSAAVMYGVAVVHLYGAEEDVGYCLDTQVRDAITKIAHLHLVMHEANAERLRMMGEESWRIKVVGNSAIDLPHIGPEPFKRFAREQGWGQGPFIASCYLPPTVIRDIWKEELEALLEAVDSWSAPNGPYTVIWAGVNADPGAVQVRERLLRHCADRPSHHFVDGLGTTLYPSLLDAAFAMTGNSSSGLLESASHRIPVVNIGVRQVGRLAGQNVLSVPASAARIETALRTALTDSAFRARVSAAVNPFHKPGSAKCIVREIKQALQLDPKVLLVKRLLPDNPAEFGGLVRIQE